MGTKRALERLIFFTDAVAAIAITLLILPLVDRASATDGGNTAEFLSHNTDQIFAFVLSFVIIARLWMANHQIMENVERSTSALMWLDVLWAFTVVLLPLPTELSAVFKTDTVLVAFYIGTMTASSLILTGIAYYLHRHPHLESDDGHTSLVRLWGIASTSVAFVVALILGVAVPHLNYYALLVLLLTFPLDAVTKPRLRRIDAQRREARNLARETSRQSDGAA